MSTRPLTRAAPAPSAEYMALVRAFPLRPIRSLREYEAAARIVDQLAIRPEGSLCPGEQDYLDTLTVLIQVHDEEHFRTQALDMEPVDVLKYLMDQSGMTGADLGRLLGNRALPSLILNGHRSLSKTHIRILAEHFKVDPGLFLTLKSAGKRRGR